MERYNIKNIQPISSRNGEGYRATLYFGDRALGDVLDDGSGGELQINISADDMIELENYAHSLPEVVIRDFSNVETHIEKTVKCNSHLFIEELVNKENRINLACREIQKGVLVYIENNDLKASSKELHITPFILDLFQKNHPNAVVLNGMTRELIEEILEKNDQANKKGMDELEPVFLENHSAEENQTSNIQSFVQLMD